MAKYRLVPGTLSVAPTKPEFSTDEDVSINVKCTVERDSVVGAGASWRTDFKVYNSSGSLIKSASSEHWFPNPFQEIDSQSDDYNIKLGKMSAGQFSGEVVVSGHG